MCTDGAQSNRSFMRMHFPDLTLMRHDNYTVRHPFTSNEKTVTFIMDPKVRTKLLWLLKIERFCQRFNRK